MKNSITKNIIIYFSICISTFIFIWLFSTTKSMERILIKEKTSDLASIQYSNINFLNLYAKEMNTSLINLSNILSLTIDDNLLLDIISSYKHEYSSEILNVIYINNGQIYSDRPHLLEIINTDIYKEIFNDTMEIPYKGIRWSEPYDSPLSLDRTVAIYKPDNFNNSLTILELNINQMIKVIFESAKDCHVAVLSNNNGIIASTIPNLPNIASGVSDNMHTVKINDDDYIFMEFKHAAYDWHIIILLPEAVIHNAIRPLITRVSLIGISFMLLLIFMLILIENHFTKPISSLSKKIIIANDLADINLDAECSRKDEIGILALSLIDMQKKLHDSRIMEAKSVEEKRKLEIRMLQNQIHPHFLGNTLACIASLIKEQYFEQGYRSIIELIKLLNYSISNTNIMTTLREEINATENYMQLRLMRSPDLFSYHISILEQHLNHLVPKLIIQPIIENAIAHGFSRENSTTNTLSIISYERQGNLFLAINNSGIPISNDDIARIMDDESKNNSSHGIGVKNVFKRLSLNEENSTGGYIQGETGKGTTVYLDLGKQQKVSTITLKDPSREELHLSHN